LSQLLPAEPFDRLRQEWRMREDDTGVIEEWDAVGASQISAPNES